MVLHLIPCISTINKVLQWHHFSGNPLQYLWSCFMLVWYWDFPTVYCTSLGGSLHKKFQLVIMSFINLLLWVTMAKRKLVKCQRNTFIKFFLYFWAFQSSCNAWNKIPDPDGSRRHVLDVVTYVLTISSLDPNKRLLTNKMRQFEALVRT